MQRPAQLLEHVAWRTARRLLSEQPRLQRVALRIDKQTPPVGMQADAVGVGITLSRDDLQGA